MMKRFYTAMLFMVIFGSWLNLASAQNVEFPDENLAKKVRAVLNLPIDANISKAELATLTVLNASAPEGAVPAEQISDLTGLEHATQLTGLDLRDNAIVDLHPLTGLTQLTWIYLSSNKIRDIAPLAELINLTLLELDGNDIRDLRPVAGLTQLTSLYLSSNAIVDISPLAGLTHLTQLFLGENQISNIHSLTGLAQLTELELYSNDIRDITPLAGLTSLTYLFLVENQISNISPLAGLTNLTGLFLWSNQISDITPLAGLTQLITLYLDSNEISDVTPLTGLVNLEELSLEGNPITDKAPLHALLRQNPDVEIYIDVEIDIIDVDAEVPPTADPAAEWMPDPNLRAVLREYLGLSAGDALTQEALQGVTYIVVTSEWQISDFTGLEHATQLTRLHLLRNGVVDLSSLADLTNLTELILSQNAVVDLSPLAGLTSLTNLEISRNTVSQNAVVDLSPLANLTNLTRLSFYSNAVVDVSPLANLTNLTSLNLGFNRVVDLSPLANLTNLSFLNLEGNQIRDISPLAGLINLTDLYLKNNPIKDASALQPLLNQIPDLNLSIDTDSIWSVSFSSDGTLLATGAANGIVQLLDVATREIIDTLDGHTDDVKSVSFSPDGTRLATGSLDGTVKLWDVVTQRTIATLEAHAKGVTSVAFSPNGLLLAAGTTDGIQLWDVNTQEHVDTLSAKNVNAVSFSPDGTRLASGEGETLDGAVKLWDLKTKEAITITEGHFTLHVLSLSFSRDGKRLAVASGSATVWDVETQEIVDSLEGNFSAVALSPDGVLLATGDRYFLASRVRLQDVNTRETLAELKGHTNDIWAVAFSPDGTLLASGAEDGSGVRLWDVATATYELVKVSGDAQEGTYGSELAEPFVVEVRDRYNTPLPGVEVTFTVTAGGGKLSGELAVEHVTTDANGRAARTLTLGNAVTNTVSISIAERELAMFDAVGNSPYQIAAFEGSTGLISSGSFSPDGTLLAIGTEEGVKLWNVVTQETIATLPAGAVFSASFSPDGQLLATGSIEFNEFASEEDEVLNSSVKLWDVATRKTIATFEGRTDIVFSVSFSPDGQLLATGLVDFTQFFSDEALNGNVKLWDVATGETLATLEGVFVSFSPDETLLATGSREGVKLWDIATQETLATLEGVFVSFSPDGMLLATGSEEGVKLWDVATQETIATLEGIVGSFSPDGTLLATGSESGTVKLWDVATQETIATLEGHTDIVPSVSFSPDGTLLATGSEEGAKLWNVASFITHLEREKLAGDVNSDGVVNIQDTAVVRANLGQRGQNEADVNGDGIVDVEDLVLVLAVIEDAAGAPALYTQALTLFTAEELQQWLIEARGLADKSPAHRRGILMLEQLLALLIPKETALLPNYPNPFNPETWIPYQLAAPADVTLTIYTINGRVVRILALGHQPAGLYQSRSHAAYWDGRNEIGESVASGVYFYTLTAGDFTATRKLLIRK